MEEGLQNQYQEQANAVDVAGQRTAVGLPGIWRKHVVHLHSRIVISLVR